MENRRSIRRVNEVGNGSYRVVSIDGSGGFVKKLTAIGIHPDADLEVLGSSMGRGMASRIYVKSVSPGMKKKIRYTLRDYKEGQKGVVIGVEGEGKFRKRILEMGFIRGAELFVEKYAPLRDPIEIIIKGYHLSLRRNEAGFIIMSKPD